MGAEVIEIAEDQLPSEPDLFLPFCYDLEGKRRPGEIFQYLGDELVRIKAVPLDRAKMHWKDQYLTKSGEWQDVPDSSDLGPMVVRGVGSSDLVDMDGDVMHKSALECMTRVQPGLNTYIEHNTTFAGLFGSLVESPTLTWRDPDGKGLLPATKSYAAIEIASDVEVDNEAALKVARYMKKGRQFGWSVGCFYTKFEPIIEKGRRKGAHVYEVKVAEWSTCTMPANQQSWAEVSHKALVRKGWLDPSDADEYRYRVINAQDFEDPIVAIRMQQLQDYFAKTGIYLCERAA